MSTEAARRPSLRHEPRFVRWAVAEAVSMVGTNVTFVVLPIVVYEATGSASQTGVLFALRVVPYLLFGVFAGPVADRGNRRLLIIGGNLAEGALVATIPLAHAFGVLTIGQIYVVGLLSATVFVFSDAAVFGAVPALVGPERLPAANGFLGSLSSAAEIIGPAVGGVLAATIGSSNAIWVDAASFGAAAVIQMGIRSPFRSEPVAAGPIAVRAQVRRALGFVRRQRTLAVLLLIGFGNSFAFGAVIGLVVPYAIEQLGFGRDDSRLGLLYSAGGAGALIAGLVFSRLFRMQRVRWISPASLAVATGAIAALAVVHDAVLAVVLLAVLSCAVATTVTTGITYRQLAAPDDLRASVNVLGRMVAWGGQPFGAALGALVAGASEVPTAFAVAAAVMGSTSLGGFVALRWAAQSSPGR